MNRDEYDKFAELIAAEAEVHRSPLSASAIRVYWSALADLSLEEVAAAILAHERNPKSGGHMPMPADIRREHLGIIDDGRPGPDEAWSIAVQLMTQDATVVVTDEIMAAAAVARTIHSAGDRIGARKAFLEKYDQLVKLARKPPGRCHWWPSLGHDPAGREGPILEAVQIGRLPAEDARKYLPYYDEPSSDIIARVVRLGGPRSDGSSD